MTSLAPISGIAQNIQLAVAPVFLLTGIGSILNVLVNRLGRIVDRARRVEAEFMSYEPAVRAAAQAELRVLGRRMAAAHWAIGFCTLSALLVCIVIAILFVGEFVALRGAGAVALLFVGAMLLLIVGLLLFLIEVRIATRSVRIRPGLLAKE